MTGTTTNMRWVHAGLVTAAFLLIVISLLPGVEWAHLERERGVGPATYRLDASLEASGFEYSLEATSSGGGVLGGLGGMNRTIGPVRKTYPEVRGDVLENLGIIYDSYKVKSYIYELVMENPPEGSGVDWPGPGSPSVYLNVTLRSDLVPYWPEAGTRTLTVTVELLKSDLHDLVRPDERSELTVTVDRIVIKALTRYDQRTGVLSGTPATLKESKGPFVLRNVGDSTVKGLDVGYPEGADVAGMFVDIEASLIDYWGRPERSPLSGGANTINIRPVRAMDAVSIIGIPLALPLLLISLVMGAISVFLCFKKKRPFLTFAAIGVALSVLALLWFWSGTNNGVELLSQRLEGAGEGLEFSWGIFMAAAGCLFYILSLATLLFWKFTSKKSTDDAPGATFKRIDGP